MCTHLMLTIVSWGGDTHGYFFPQTAVLEGGASILLAFPCPNVYVNIGFYLSKKGKKFINLVMCEIHLQIFLCNLFHHLLCELPENLLVKLLPHLMRT